MIIHTLGISNLNTLLPTVGIEGDVRRRGTGRSKGGGVVVVVVVVVAVVLAAASVYRPPDSLTHTPLVRAATLNDTAAAAAGDILVSRAVTARIALTTSAGIGCCGGLRWLERTARHPPPPQ